MSARHRIVHWLGVVVLLSAALTAVPVPGEAQGPEPAWQPTNLPAGGWVQDLLTHPAASGRVYALLQDTGPFRSDDGGLTWQRAAGGLPYEPTAVRLYNTLTVDPADPGVLYLGLGASGFSTFAHVYRSTDGGTSWQPRGSGIPATEVNDIAVSPQNAQILYAATNDGVYRSADGGANWQARGWAGSWLRAVAVDPANQDHVLILIDGEVHASNDGGLSWHPASMGLPVPGGSSPSSRLAFDPNAPNTAYLTGLIVDGFYRSTDGGETWSAVNDGFEGALPTLTGLALRPTAPTGVYAATMSGVYRLDGDRWTRLSPNLEGEMRSFPNALALDATSGTLFLGYWHGVYRSTDTGQSWTPTGPGLNSARIEAVGVAPDNGQRVFAAAGNRLFRSSDGGATWTPALSREANRAFMIAVDPRNTNHVYYSIFGQPLRHSLDGGATWTEAPGARSLPYDTRAIRFHRTDPQRLYLAGPHNFSSHTTEQGVYRSRDGGQTWQQVENQLRAIELALSADGATVYAASVSQILRTLDDGATWMVAQGGLPPGWGFVYGLQAHPSDPNVAWVATGGAGVFRTADRGATWQPMNDGLPGGYVTALAVRPANGDAVLYAGTRFGVYVSRSGQPWVPLGSGLPEYAQWTNSLAVTPSGRVYVGTDFGGLWTLQDEGGVEPPDPCRGIPLGRGQIWIAETGFAVQGMWLDWFNDHGGLDILGFPRSPVTADPMDPSMCVQYFQRGILEWHPENTDPWRIQRRLLVDIMMPGIDPPVSPRQPNGPDYWYFPPTGHAVSNYAPDGTYIGFKSFFDRYGREDTFGYPMEEPKRRRGQDGVERWTQRFQAALFEYHREYDIPGLKPGTNIPWRNWIVELGLLGDQYIAQNNLNFGVICTQAPMLGFGKVWHDHARVQQRLRCPTGLERGQTIVEQPFQHGWMFRREDTGQIYVVRDTGQWSVYSDTWHPGEPEIDPTIDVPAGVYQPRQGLGKVWRMLSHPPVYDGGGLYWAVSPDRAFRGSAQDFEHGTMVWSDRRVIYVFYDDGTWESYTDYFGQ